MTLLASLVYASPFVFFAFLVGMVALMWGGVFNRHGIDARDILILSLSLSSIPIPPGMNDTDILRLR